MTWADQLARLSAAGDAHFAEIVSYQPMAGGTIAGGTPDATRPALALTGIFCRTVDGKAPEDKRGTGRDDLIGMVALAGEARFSVLVADFAGHRPAAGDRLTRSDGITWRVAAVAPDADRFVLGLVTA